MDYRLRATNEMPFIELLDNGHMVISGRSIPEDSDQFWYPVIFFIKNFPNTPINFILYFQYYNTLSIRYINFLFSELKQKNVESIKWIYEEDDEDVKEMGEYLRDRFNKMPIKLVKTVYTSINDI